MTRDVHSGWAVAIALTMTLAVSIPMFLFSTVFGDDWAWVWVYHWQGAAGIQDYMWRVAHPGFGPVYNLAFWLGGDEPGRAARAFAVAFLLGSGLLLWRIFYEGRSPPIFAVSVAALYLTSPYLGGLRDTLDHSGYDAYVFFSLLSILLSARRGVFIFIGAILAHAIGMLLESLAAVEVVRWWYLYQQGYGPRALVRRAIPFILVVVAFGISRATWMAPYGDYYAGHNALELSSVSEFAHQIYLHLQYFFSALEPLRYVPSLFVHDNLLIGGVIVLFAAGLAAACMNVTPRGSYRGLAVLAILGVVTLGLGMLPYVAIARPPYWWIFYSRLAVASQFGVFILGAVFISALPWRALRAVTLAAAVLVFSAMHLQLGRWMLYDHLVVSDFQSQLARYFASNPCQLLFIHFQPQTADVLFVKRCLANYDVNVALDVSGRRNDGLAYDKDCAADIVTEDGKCGVTAFERIPCPPKRNAEFRLHPGMEAFTRLHLVGLGRRTLSGSGRDSGTLVGDPRVVAATPRQPAP